MTPPAGPDKPSRAGWAKAPDVHRDPRRLAAVRAATERDRAHYLRGGMREIECRTCHARVLVKKTSEYQTSVQWNADARSRCTELEGDRPVEGERFPRPVAPTCLRLSASIDHGVAEGIIPTASPPEDPDGYW